MRSPQYVSEALAGLRRSQARPGVVVLGAVLTMGVFAVDAVLPLGIAGGIPYIAPVFLAMWLPDRRLILGVAAFCSLLTMAGMVLSPEGLPLSIALTNRLLAIAAIWTVAVLSLQRRAFEGALAQREATLRAVLATTADGILTLDAQGCIASANPAAARIFGHDEQELQGQPFTTLLAAEHRSRLGSAEALAPAPRMHECAARHRSGRVFPLEVIRVPLEHDGMLRSTITVRDISDRRHLEQHLLRSAHTERRTLGYSLHEELGQSLTGLSLLSRQLARRLARHHPDVAGEADELAALLHEVDQQVLGLYRSVVPLEATGSLGDALDELTATYARRYGTDVTTHDLHRAGFADTFTSAQFYLLIKELLATVLERAQATHVHLAAGAEGEENWLRLDVDGAFEADAWDEWLHLLAYRATLIGVHTEPEGAGPHHRRVTFRWGPEPLAVPHVGRSRHAV